MESSSKDKLKTPSYYYETSDLVIIALFAALGGVFSSVIAHVANIFNSIIVGGGQLFAGLHVFWFVLVFLFTKRKKGAVILTGIIKGFVELFMGNPLGFIVVIISIGEATVFEIVYLIQSKMIFSQKFNHIEIVIAAGLATSTNMIILLTILLGQGLPPDLILLMLLFSFISGIIFGGYLGLIFHQLFQQSGLLDWRKENGKPNDSFSRHEPPE
ncbi:MAG: ECF transporter S component [Candidatus Hodarchaeales archaeon]|jgi:ABC-type thiamin/hydroxymethylpyrimidine transport system permease subunit